MQMRRKEGDNSEMPAAKLNKRFISSQEEENLASSVLLRFELIYRLDKVRFNLRYIANWINVQNLWCRNANYFAEIKPSCQATSNVELVTKTIRQTSRKWIRRGDKETRRLMPAERNKSAKHYRVSRTVASGGGASRGNCSLINYLSIL
ncbi:unnamed protein product [Lasius platythorax]|uniref:Uncharacterized protein n=1 Tax=Lasius platythorax TaxID=488582 RepID=A0AAV2P0W3_9HYME